MLSKGLFQLWIEDYLQLGGKMKILGVFGLILKQSAPIIKIWKYHMNDVLLKISCLKLNFFTEKVQFWAFAAFVLQAIVRLTEDNERLHMLQAVYDTYDLQPVPAGDASDAPQPNSCRFVFIGEYKTNLKYFSH